MKLGTHNSGTGGELIWWLKPLAWIINPTSKCQDRSIKEQLEDGIKVFNIQIAYFKGEWRFSHGLALYKESVEESLAMIKACSTKEDPIYIQIYLDKCFWCKQNVKEFEILIKMLTEKYCDDNFVILSSKVEGTQYHPYSSGVRIDMVEHYWSKSWGKKYGESWIDRLPLPKRHVKKWNVKYKSECKHEYLMLDFYNY